jgi:acetyl esterase/lipase
VNAPIDIADAQTLDFAALQAAQGAGNSNAGPRTVPAKVLPIPSDLEPATAMLVAAPYSQFWNLNAPDDAGWREIVKQFDTAGLPELAKGRAALGVTIEPTTLGGVKAFILTPKEIPTAHKNQLVFNLHGGGYFFGAGESGTAEAMLMAAFGGYKVVAIDYRMAPDTPYPAGMDDATAAWRAVAATMDPRRIAVEGTSAGAGMTLSLMLRAKAEGLPLPGAIAPGSLASRPDEHVRQPQDQRMGRQRAREHRRSLPKGRFPAIRARPGPQGSATIAYLMRLPRNAARHPHDRHPRPVFSRTRYGCIASCAGPASSRSCRSTRVCRTRNTCSTRR